MLIEVKVSGLIIDPNSSSPIVILKGVSNDVVLPIWVGSYEANAIALEIEKMIPERPMTHDLLRNFIVQLNWTIERVVVNDLLNNTYYAMIEISDSDGKNLIVDSRPSDAIALALRVDCPIFVTKRVHDISVFTTANASRKPVAESNPDIPDDWPDIIG